MDASILLAESTTQAPKWRASARYSLQRRSPRFGRPEGPAHDV